MQYIASLSYGKDSLYMLEVIHKNKLPLDRIVHAEIMATKDISADLPPMMEFKEKADRIILNRYGIKVEHIKSKYTYEEYFYKKRSAKAKKENINKMYGFPIQNGNWCNSVLKMSVLNKLNKKDTIQYVGIAADEPQRYHVLNNKKISPLIDYNTTEKECFEWCKNNNLLSPIYKKQSVADAGFAITNQ